jgi:hypothetical protein
MSTVTGWRKRQIADEIHSCSPFCTRPMCVAEAVQAEREACAKLCEDLRKKEIAHWNVYGMDGAHYSAGDCAAAIRARGQA